MKTVLNTIYRFFNGAVEVILEIKKHPNRRHYY